MGVHGTFCQLCALPTQHDHYVPTAGGMLKIYRGSGENGGHTWEADERPFVFGPEHGWLKDAVVLPWDEARVLRGAIEDGALEDVLVFEGGEDGLAFHHACWELQGSPDSTGPAVRANGCHAWALVESYHEQLFDFRGLADDGKAWMLADPRSDARSRARIASMLETGRREVTEAPKDVPGVIAADRDWSGMSVRDEGQRRRSVVRARTYSIEQLDKTGYPEAVHVTLPYPGELLPGPARMQELEAFELSLRTALEADAAALFCVAAVGKGRAELIAWARDGAATRTRIQPLVAAAGATLEVRADPTWQAAARLLTEHRGPARD